MEKIFSNKLVLSVFFLLTGIILASGYYKYSQPRHSLSLMSELGFPNSPFEIFKNDPFFEDDLLKDRFPNISPQFSSIKFSEIGEIKQREDSQYIYYEIETAGHKPKQFNVAVQDGRVVITGKLEVKKNDEYVNSVVSSSFHRTFPVPPEVDGENFKLEQNDKKIIIKFPKTATS